MKELPGGFIDVDSWEEPELGPAGSTGTSRPPGTMLGLPPGPQAQNDDGAFPMPAAPKVKNRRTRKPYDPNRPTPNTGGEQIGGLLEPLTPSQSAAGQAAAADNRHIFGTPELNPLPRPPKNYRRPSGG
jgi:hypothetical protein